MTEVAAGPKDSTLGRVFMPAPDRQGAPRPVGVEIHITAGIPCCRLQPYPRELGTGISYRRALTADPTQSQVTIREMLYAMSQKPRIRLPQMIT